MSQSQPASNGGFFIGLIAAITRDKVRYMPLFTVENAAMLAAKAHEARRRNKEARRLAADQTPKSPQQAAPIAEEFAAKRLLRVRKQLERIDKMIEHETDPQKLDRLAAASMRLNDQEFALANRPKPGNYKPTAQKQAKRAYTQIPSGWQPPPQAPPPEFA